MGVWIVRDQFPTTRTVRGVSAILLAGLCVCGPCGCSSPTYLSNRRGEATAAPGHPAHGDKGGESGLRNVVFRSREKNFPPVSAAIPKVQGAEMVKDDELCMTCHEAYVKAHHTNVHRGQSCEACHGPGSQHIRTRGTEPGMILSFKRMSAAERGEVCLQCHQNDACAPGTKWRTSAHAHAGVSCTECHKSHYNVPPGTPATKVADATQQPGTLQLVQAKETKKDAVDMQAIRAASRSLGAADVQTCFRCHQKEADLHRVAHPHQICGAVGFQCTTCHDPHGNIREASRTDMCLECHKGHPTMAWKSSIHSHNGVACTDCHNPHPNSKVSPFVDIQHTHIRRPKRLPMSVEEPFVCYQCHQKTAAQFELPSHHPVREGKMVCSDCHDSHGAQERHLREPTVNLTCYRCHSEKAGPFVWEHPPVSENCGICHNPHGAVANNLLHQPATFLCLRCHSGHRGRSRNIDQVQLYRPAFYSDCSQCHSQVHGSDLPAATRFGPRLTR